MANGWMSQKIRPWLIALSVVRPVNLLFIALTQYLIFFHFLFPLLLSAGATPLLLGWRAWAFLLATTLVAAAGYAINDFYDIAADRINKPRKWLLGKDVHLYHAKFLTFFTIMTGAALSLAVAWDIGALHLWVLYPTALFLLWAYSRFLKGTPILGNLLIAALCALVIGIVWFAERRGLGQLPSEVVNSLIFYLGFAFLANLFREIVKDCEDVEGDARYHQQTFPVLAGLNRAKWLAFAIGILLEAALVWLVSYFFKQADWMGMLYAMLLLLLPLGWGLVLLVRTKGPMDYIAVSRAGKWVIFAGVFLILLLP
jgi:4-hydroxybenzoate polyprenyltransferase